MSMKRCTVNAINALNAVNVIKSTNKNIKHFSSLVKYTTNTQTNIQQTNFNKRLRLNGVIQYNEIIDILYDYAILIEKKDIEFSRDDLIRSKILNGIHTDATIVYKPSYIYKLNNKILDIYIEDNIFIDLKNYGLWNGRLNYYKVHNELSWLINTRYNCKRNRVDKEVLFMELYNNSYSKKHNKKINVTDAKIILKQNNDKIYMIDDIYMDIDFSTYPIINYAKYNILNSNKNDIIDNAFMKIISKIKK